MATKVEERTYEDAVSWLREHGFDLIEAPGTQNRVFLRKFLKTTKTEVPASADHLKALHQFSEELKEALGTPSLYNESLGTVSESYQYDRIKDRDKPELERPKRPWQAVNTKVTAAKKSRA